MYGIRTVLVLYSTVSTCIRTVLSVLRTIVQRVRFVRTIQLYCTINCRLYGVCYPPETYPPEKYSLFFFPEVNPSSGVVESVS